MPANYVLLEKITVGAATAASVTFSGIPQTGYTDLKIVALAKSNRSLVVDGSTVRFNGDNTSGNYTMKRLLGDGASPSSDTTYESLFTTGATATANTFGNSELYIPNYTSGTAKSFSADSSQETNGTTAYLSLHAGLWSGTASITSITISPAVGTLFLQYSSFYLYGVAKLATTPAIAPFATGGDTIMTDGTYWYHTFISSGTFTPAKALTADYLVVAGGGGGASFAVGPDYNSGVAGSNSVFATITSTGGGFGSKFGLTLGGNGGSGGGAGGKSSGGGTNAGGTGTSGQGYAGGTGIASAQYGGGGGGGAGAVGANGTTTVSGAGGAGVATSISGSSVTYAGGGGGGAWSNLSSAGAGGTGGGGAGGRAADGTSGTANTGGGGGGGDSGIGAGQGGGGAGGLRSTVTATGGGGSLESALSLASSTGYTVTIGAGGAGGNVGAGTGKGGNGGSGIVIVRYAV
jgi:hypothetical protein